MIMKKYKGRSFDLHFQVLKAPYCNIYFPTNTFNENCIMENIAHTALVDIYVAGKLRCTARKHAVESNESYMKRE